MTLKFSDEAINPHICRSDFTEFCKITRIEANRMFHELRGKIFELNEENDL